MAVGGCSYHATIGPGGTPIGQTQEQVISGMPPGQRVLFRDSEQMIVEDAAGRRTRLRFEGGRVDSTYAEPPALR